MEFTRTNILTDTPGGKSMSSGGIILEGNQGGGGGEYIHPTGWLWGNKYTGRETLDGDLTSHGTIRALNINANNLTAINADITNLDATNITSVNADIHNLIAEYGDIRYLNVLEQLNAWGADIDHATIRDLYVSGSAHFVELIIDKLNSTNGSLILSPAHATISRVEERNGLIYCYFPASDGEKEISNDFDIDDLVICQSFNVVEGENHDASNKFIWKRVVDKGTIDISDSESEMFTKEHWFSVMKTGVINDDYIHPSCNSEFELGDVVCTLGNWTKEGRQKAILLTSTNPNFVDIGNIVGTEPYDIHVYDTENQYIRTAPIGTTSDIAEIEVRGGDDWLVHNKYQRVNFDLSEWSSVFDSNGDVKFGNRFEIKFRPNLKGREYRSFPDGPIGQPPSDGQLLMRIKNFELYLLTQDDVPIMEWDEWGDYTILGYRDTFTLYLKYTTKRSVRGSIVSYSKYIRTLQNVVEGEPYTFRLIYDDNQDVEGSYVDYDRGDDFFRLNFAYDCDDYRPERINDMPGTTPWWEGLIEPDNSNIEYNHVFDLYSICGYNFNQEISPYKPTSSNQNLILNGDFNTNQYWDTNFGQPAEGYGGDLVDTSECVYIRRPLAREVYQWQGVLPTGKYLNSNNFNLDNGFYKITFDYFVNNDTEYPFRPIYAFQFSLLKSDWSERYDRFIYPERIGNAHKCTIILGVGQSYNESYLRTISKNYIQIDSGEWFIGFNTDGVISNKMLSINPNQIIIDNVQVTRMYSTTDSRIYIDSHSHGEKIHLPVPYAVTQDNVDYRRYRNVIENPIDAPAIITFNNVNRFSLAGKHVSVLSPTYNLISASSVSGLSDLADSVSSLTNRVTTCESAIETNSQQILLKVNQTDFDRLSRTVENQGTRITQNASAISLKADQSTVDSMGTTISSLSSELLIQAGQISSMVTSISSINDTLVQYDTRITQNATSITLKADQSTVDSLSQTVTNQGTLIAQNATAITLKADQTTVDSLGITVSSLSSELTIQAGEISSLVSSVSSINGEVVSLWSSITQLPDQISAYVYTELDGDLTQTGIDITNHQISLTADNFIVKNNNNNPTLYLNSQGLVESRLGFVTNPRTGSEETFNPTFYALSMERQNNDPLAYSIGLSGFNKAYQGSPVINQNPDYTDSALCDFFKVSTEIYNRTSDLQYRIPILTMQQDDFTMYDGNMNYIDEGLVSCRTTMKLQPKELSFSWNEGGTPQLGLVKDLDGNMVPGIESWIGGVSKCVTVGVGHSLLKDASVEIITGWNSTIDDWISAHSLEWSSISVGELIRVKKTSGDRYSTLIIKELN